MQKLFIFALCCIALFGFVLAEEGAPSDVIVLTSENFDGQIETGGTWLLEL
jgi:hypothetical protein